MPSTFSVLYCLVTALSLAQGHSWVERLTNIDADGSFTGSPGYPRAYVPRIAGLKPDSNTNLIKTKTAEVCGSLQSKPGQTSGYPVLVAPAGGWIALQYQENGHVSNTRSPVGKPIGSGIINVYGTNRSQSSTTVADVLSWNARGSGGNKGGRLLARQFFDDGRCYGVGNNNPRQSLIPVKDPTSIQGKNLWCQNDLQLPADASLGSYTLYWLWDWPTFAGTPQEQTEIYTTCMDLNITDDTPPHPTGVVPLPNFMNAISSLLPRSSSTM